MSNFNTPVLFLIYNRPEPTLQVFNAIRQIKPAKLFVVADGPKSADDGIKCGKAREIISNIDWDCEVKTLFREKNIGSKYSVSSGINWMFGHVDECIILEDDCVPGASFFRFCSELLERYRDNENIMHITGTNLNYPAKSNKYTYYFSNYPNIWGWATWKRAWKKYDVELADTEFYKKLIRTRFKDPFERRFWNTVLKTLNKLDAWDYQWMFSIWKAGGLCANTNYNLVSNIGFNEDATHTRHQGPYSNLPAQSISTIVHPEKIAIDKEAEAELLRTLHSVERRGYFAYFLMRGGNLAHKIKLLINSKKG